MGLNADIENIKKRFTDEYNEYKSNLANLMNEYTNRSGEFNVLIGEINAERLAFRKEIKVLYDFLQSIGGSLKDEKRISVFDFADEAPAPSQLYSEQPILKAPDFKQNGLAEILQNSLLKTALDHRKDKKKYSEFLVEVEQKKNDYEKDLADRKNQIANMKDAIEIAKIYRNIIVTVRDTVSEKILTELDFIQAFLYADAIRERIMDGESPEDVTTCGISEYKNTQYDIHYQFVRNTFDFYKISTGFFKKTVLTDILADKVVTPAEKEEFEMQISAIKSQIKIIESKKVI